MRWEWSAPAGCFRSKVRWDRRASVARGAAPRSEQSDAKQPGHSNVRAVCFRRTHDTGAALYRSAPFVPKGLFYVNRSVYLFSLNHFNAFICWVELKRILDCHKRSGIIPAICHSFFHCCHCRILEPASLMSVIDPTADDIAILHLRNGISNIATIIFTLPWHRKSGKNIGTCLLSPENAVGCKSLIVKRIIRGGEGFPTLVIQHTSSYFTVRSPSI